MNVTDFERAIDEAEKEWGAQGKLIEGGWAGLRATWMPNATPDQVKVVRYAFMAGAQHMFWLFMSLPDDLAAEDGLDRLALIRDELMAFRSEVHRDMPTKGSA